MKANTMQHTFKQALTLTFTFLLALAPQAISGFGCPSDCSSCIVNRYANTETITLNIPSLTGNQPGIPSPSQILVNNIPKCHIIKGLEVTFTLTYSAANRLAVALLSPCGDCIILLNEVGADGTGFGVEDNPATFVFSDCKGTTLDCDLANPQFGADQTLQIKPTDCAPGNYCFNGALDTTFCTTKLSKTFRKPANGCWQLFTCIKSGDNQIPTGTISSWRLKITHGLPAKDGCFDLFTSNCCGSCNC